MTDGVILTVGGLADVGRLLDSFKGDVRKVVRGALRDAAKPMVDAAKSLAPVLKTRSNRRIAGVMRKNIRVVTSKRDKGQNGVYSVYVTVSARRTKGLKRAPISGDPFYFKFVEAGHNIVPRGKGTKGLSRGEIRSLTKQGLRKTITARRLEAAASRAKAATGRVRPYPFLGPAFERTSKQVVDRFQEAIARRVAQANAAGA